MGREKSTDRRPAGVSRLSADLEKSGGNRIEERNVDSRDPSQKGLQRIKSFD